MSVLLSSLHLGTRPRTFVRGGSLVLLALLLASCDLLGGGSADIRAPSVTITRPGSGSVVAGANVLLRISAEALGDTDNAISFINVLANDEFIGSADADGEGNFALRWNTFGLSDGVYNLTAVAFDNNQSRGLSESIQVTINNGDGTGPAVEIVNPQEGDVVSGNVTITVEKLNSSDQVDRVDFLIDGVSVGTDEAPNALGQFTYVWNTSNESDGFHAIEAKAYDNQGNFSFSAPVSVTVDAAAGGGGSGSEGACGLGEDFLFAGEVFGSIAVGNNGDIYFGTTADTLYALASDGTLRWERQVEGEVVASAAVSNSNNIFVTTESGRLHKFSQSGSERWVYNANARVLATPTLSLKSVIYFGDADGEMHAVESINGVPINGWPVRVSDFPIEVPAILNEEGTRLYTAATDGFVYALDADDGSQVWKSGINVGSVQDAMAVVDRQFTIDLPGGQQQTTTINVIYIVSNSGRLYALNGDDGTVIWDERINGPNRAGPIVGPDGAIYVSTSTGMMAFDEEVAQGDDRLRFIFDIETGDMPAMDSNQNIYFMSGTTLYGISPTQSILVTEELGTQVSGPLTIDRSGRILFAGRNKRICAYETGSAGLAPGKWPMYQGNARHTGRLGDDDG